MHHIWKTKIGGYEMLTNHISVLREYGPQYLTGTDLFRVLLDADENKMETIMKKYTIKQLSQAGVTELQPIVGQAVAEKIVATFEIARRVQSYTQSPTPEMLGPSDVYNYIAPKLWGKEQEHFVVLCLDAQSRLIKAETVSIGTLDTAIASPRDVCKVALKYNAKSIILVHNHPSGDPTPSKADKDTTQKIFEGAKLLEISVVDHLIVGDHRYISLRSEGIL
jgi:DNA repair protein RadC